MHIYRNIHNFLLMMKAIEQFFHFCIVCWSLAGIGVINSALNFPPPRWISRNSLFYIFYRFNGYSKSLCDNKLSSPVWGSNEIQLWELIIFAFLLFYPDTVTFFSILFLFVLIKIFVGGAYGTMWCAITNLIAFYFLYKY